MERLWEVPATWEWSVIGNLGDVLSGGTPATMVPEYWGGDIIWFAPSDLTGYQGKHIAQGAKTITEEGLAKSSAKIMAAGSVMFSSRAPIGYVAINSAPAATNQGFKSIVPHREFFNEYLYHYLKAAKHIAEERASGTTFKELSGSAFSALPVPIAPANEQHRIVERIETLFDEIDRGVESLHDAKRAIGLYRQSLLKSAFEGHLTADWRAKNLEKPESPDRLIQRIRKERETRYRLALDDWEREVAIWNEQKGTSRKPLKPKRPADFAANSSLPTEEHSGVPNQWLWLSLSNLGRVSGGLTKNQKRNVLPLKAKYLRVANVHSNCLNLNEIKEIGVTEEELRKTRLTDGDLLFVEGNGSIEQIGRVAIWNDSVPDVTHQNHLIRFSTNGLLSPRFALYFMISPVGRMLITAQASSTSGLHTLSISKLKGLPVPLCSPAEQNEIVRILNERLAAAGSLETEIDANLSRAEALRQSILKQAFSGQLVPQNPKDEPAAILLGRINAETASQKPTGTTRRS